MVKQLACRVAEWLRSRSRAYTPEELVPIAQETSDAQEWIDRVRRLDQRTQILEPKLGPALSRDEALPTASEATPEQLHDAWELRNRHGCSWSEIETRVGLRAARGMTAMRAVARYESGS